jgi:uncharacterized protein (DUF58 family)
VKKQGPAKNRSARLPRTGVLGLLLIYLFAPWYLIRFVSLFVLVLVVSSKLYSDYLMHKLKIRRRDTELRNFRREWVSVEIIVENHGRLPAFMLAVHDSPGILPVFRENRSLCSLGARSRMVLNWQVYGSDRGRWILGPVTVRGSDPLGMFPFFITPRETVTLFVYPAAAFAELNRSDGIPLGILLSPNPLHEDLTRYRSLRPYQSGDEPRRINWKVSARMASMVVNEYEATGTFPLCIFLNLKPEAYPLNKRALFTERVIEAAVALCLMAERDRQELGIVLYDGVEAVSVIAPGAFTLIPILERLAIFLPRDGNLPDTGARTVSEVMLEQGKYLPYGTRYIYAGPNLTDEEYLMLNTLKRQHLSLDYCVIDEQSLPPTVPGQSRRYSIKEYDYHII